LRGAVHPSFQCLIGSLQSAKRSSRLACPSATHSALTKVELRNYKYMFRGPS